MGFKPITVLTGVKFNSQLSLNFLDSYENYIEKCQIEEANKRPSAVIAPSSFYCDRLSWFRLRGVDPDKDQHLDANLSWKARLGTAIHILIQSELKAFLKDDWVRPAEYLEIHPIAHEYEIEEGELETKFKFIDIPIQFACDGLIRLNGKIYLLEIKTIESSTFNMLSESEPRHQDQVKCYCTMLDLDGAVFLYVDRNSGELKCYEFQVKQSDKDAVLRRIENIQKLSECNIAPDRLLKFDGRCSYCKYRKRCKEWG